MELTTTQKRQRLLTMIFGAIAIFFTGYPSRMVDLSAIRDGTGRLEPDGSIYVFLSGIEYIRIWKYHRWKIAG